ncbi:MAG: sensor histidine kinase [Bacteroidota bacterium]
MPLRSRSSVLYSIVVLVALLLLINVAVIYRNSQEIELNKRIQEDAERAKVNTLDIIRNLHLLDIGIRGYGLIQSDAFYFSIDSARVGREPIFRRLEMALKDQSYPRMSDLHTLRDSVNGYFAFAEHLLHLVKTRQQDEFLRLLAQDRGYALWVQYKRFSADVETFENAIVLEAKSNYERALRNSYLLQLLLFLLTVPSLVYMAYYASRTFQLSETLRKSEVEKNLILQQQNERLDQLVQQKTKAIQAQNDEIMAQNEEIMAQNEEIRAHNDQLVMQQMQIEKSQVIISTQAEQIQRKNEELQTEVNQQTLHLRQTNAELVERNSRLEQFSYIISHNLRAPLARVQGLADLMNKTMNDEEKKHILDLLVQSSLDLDSVIRDLSLILSIQKSNTQILTPVSLTAICRKVADDLRPEVERVGATIELELSSDSFPSLAPYVETVVYNLVSNAIKYRDPERPLKIKLKSNRVDHQIQLMISDNGLGINLHDFRDQIFNLYKRFHLHVEGKGVGLYLVKTQMEALGGKIEVDSEVNKGTVFTLYFKA